MIPTDVQVKAAYKQANEEAKEYINSDDLFNAFYTIRTKYNLHVDVAGNLALLVNAVILELTSLSDFPAQLKEILSSSSETEYQAILKSVNDEVFVAFRQRTKERAEAKVREQKEFSEKKAKEDAEDQALELEFKKEFEAKKAELLAARAVADSAPAGTSTSIETTAPTLVPPVVPTVPPAPTTSIVEQKITVASAPGQQQTAVPPPQQKPQAPTRYHGTDPYREMAE